MPLITAAGPGPVGRFLGFLDQLGGHEEKRAGQIQRRPEEEDEDPAKARHGFYGSTRGSGLDFHTLAGGPDADCSEIKACPVCANGRRRLQAIRWLGPRECPSPCRSGGMPLALPWMEEKR